MKSIFVLSIIIILTEFSFSQKTIDCNYDFVSRDNIDFLCRDGNFVYVWGDEFDDGSLDLSKWELSKGWVRHCTDNNEPGIIQYYIGSDDPDYNTIIDESGGTLKLKALYKGSFTKYCYNPCTWQLGTYTFNYKSAEIQSKYKFYFGKYIIRCKMPKNYEGKSSGFWPAFWLYGVYERYNELDIFDEMFNDNNHTNVWNEMWDELNDRRDINYWEYAFSSDYNNNVNIDDSESCGDITWNVPNFNNPTDFSNWHTFTLYFEPYYIKIEVRNNSGDLLETWQVNRVYDINGDPVGCETSLYYPDYFTCEGFPVEPMTLIANLAVNDEEPYPPHTGIFEIDYIRYYKRDNCNDVYITNNYDLHLNSEKTYQIIYGENITIDVDNAQVDIDEYLELIAKNKISIKSGFNAKAGKPFIARIDPNLCSKSYASNNTNNQLNKYKKFDSNMNLEDSTSIKVYPNPNNGKFFLAFNGNLKSVISLKIYNITGNTIYETDILNGKYTLIDIRNQSKGTYIIKLITNQGIINKKLIIQ